MFFERRVYTPLQSVSDGFFVYQRQGGVIATIGNIGTRYSKTGNSDSLDCDGIDDLDCIGGYSKLSRNTFSLNLLE